MAMAGEDSAYQIASKILGCEANSLCEALKVFNVNVTDILVHRPEFKATVSFVREENSLKRDMNIIMSAKYTAPLSAHGVVNAGAGEAVEHSNISNGGGSILAGPIEAKVTYENHHESSEHSYKVIFKIEASRLAQINNKERILNNMRKAGGKYISKIKLKNSLSFTITVKSKKKFDKDTQNITLGVSNFLKAVESNLDIKFTDSTNTSSDTIMFEVDGIGYDSCIPNCNLNRLESIHEEFCNNVKAANSTISWGYEVEDIVDYEKSEDCPDEVIKWLSRYNNLKDLMSKIPDFTFIATNDRPEALTELSLAQETINVQIVSLLVSRNEHIVVNEEDELIIYHKVLRRLYRSISELMALNLVAPGCPFFISMCQPLSDQNYFLAKKADQVVISNREREALSLYIEIAAETKKYRIYFLDDGIKYYFKITFLSELGASLSITKVQSEAGLWSFKGASEENVNLKYLMANSQSAYYLCSEEFSHKLALLMPCGDFSNIRIVSHESPFKADIKFLQKGHLGFNPTFQELLNSLINIFRHAKLNAEDAIPAEPEIINPHFISVLKDMLDLLKIYRKYKGIVDKEFSRRASSDLSNKIKELRIYEETPEIFESISLPPDKIKREFYLEGFWLREVAQLTYNSRGIPIEEVCLSGVTPKLEKLDKQRGTYSAFVLAGIGYAPGLFGSSLSTDFLKIKVKNKYIRAKKDEIERRLNDILSSAKELTADEIESIKFFYNDIRSRLTAPSNVATMHQLAYIINFLKIRDPNASIFMDLYDACIRHGTFNACSDVTVIRDARENFRELFPVSAAVTQASNSNNERWADPDPERPATSSARTEISAQSSVPLAAMPIRKFTTPFAHGIAATLEQCWRNLSGYESNTR